MGEALLVRRGGALANLELFIEPGLIVEWYGLSSTIPEGWGLCNGTNGTPNLSDQCIVGAGSTYSIGSTGGNANSIVPSHTHTASVNAFNHGHTLQAGEWYSSAGSLMSQIPQGYGDRCYEASYASSYVFNGPTGAAGAHSHTVSVNSTGSDATNANLPPYLSLFYIIKLEE